MGMLRLASPQDFVIATGESHSLEEFENEALHQVGLDWRQRVDFDPALVRPFAARAQQRSVALVGFIRARRYAKRAAAFREGVKGVSSSSAV